MLFDQKKAITTMMARRKSNGDRSMGPAPMKPEIMKDADGEMDGRHAAAQDMMGAMHEKSPAKLMEAMANFIDIHSARKDAAIEDFDGVQEE